MEVLYPGRIGIWSVGFCGGRKTIQHGEKPLEQGENQQQAQPTYGTDTELHPGHIGGRCVLSPLYPPCSPLPDRCKPTTNLNMIVYIMP